MMRISLLSDYRGVLTDEEYFTAGEYEAGPGLPMSEGMARALVSAGRAVEIEKERPASQVKKVVKRRSRK